MSHESHEEGSYFYGVLAANDKRDFGPIGIGERGDVVYTLPYQDIAAIISRSPITKYPVTRKNALTHAKVLDRAREEATVIPARFGTIAESDEAIVDKVLKPHYQDFSRLLKEMEGKAELGVKVSWLDMDKVFAEIVEENKDIKAEKEALLREKDAQKRYDGTVKVGQLVQEALEEKKKAEAEELLNILRPLSLNTKEGQTHGDENFLNAFFLVAREKVEEFDEKIRSLREEYKGRKYIKYVFSSIPYNFVVGIEIHL